ncbi:hypothetical protein, partial [Sporisorium scitamineum]
MAKRSAARPSATSPSTHPALPSSTSTSPYYDGRPRRTSSTSSDVTLPPLHTALSSNLPLQHGSALPPPLLPPTSSSAHRSDSSSYQYARPTSSSNSYKPFITPNQYINSGRVTVPSTSS